jgi:Putative MetA-pathway of phenol degradation
MRFGHRAALLCLVVVMGLGATCPLTAFADQLLLSYGDRISGRIIFISKETIRMETPASGIIDIARKYVEQVTTDEPRIVELISGERVIGQLIAAEGKSVIVRSPILGDRRIPLDAIDAVPSSAPTEGDARSSLSQIQGKGAGTSGRPNPSQPQQPGAIGPRPEDVGDIRKIFLRQSTVLLHPGELEVEAIFNYQHTQLVSSILNARFRQFQVPLAIRGGLFGRGEGFLTIPATYVHREVGFADSGVSQREVGIGDMATGLNYELAGETASRPNIIASVGLATPTGTKPNEQGLSLGTGHWSATAGLQFIKTVDPVALFGGINYAHQYAARYFLGDGVHNVDPGEIAGYNFGFGFAVNENVSLSAQITASYQGGIKTDGKKIFASSREPAILRSALTYRHSRATYIESSLSIGLDQDTPDFAVGLSLTHRFDKGEER